MLHPDSHLEFNDATAQPFSAVAEIIAQLSLKAGLKQWGEKAKNAMQAEMKQLHFRNTLDPRHCSNLIKKEKAELLESYIFSRKRYTERLRDEQWQVGINSATSFKKKNQVLQTWPLKLSC